MNLHEKRISAFFMATLMILSACIVPFFANGVDASWFKGESNDVGEIVASGVDGEVYWFVQSERSGYTLRIEPVNDNKSAKMYDYQPVGTDIAPWRNCGFDINRVFIDDYAAEREFSLNYIGSYAFYGMTSLTYVGLSKHIITIGEGAFYGCTKLQSVNAPNDQRGTGLIIKDYAFYGCKNLNVQQTADQTKILYNASYVGEHAFDGCTEIDGDASRIYIGTGTYYIGDGAFDNCNIKNFSVEKGNQYYSTGHDGVLMSKDGTKIIRCPERFGKSTFSIDGDVEEIADGAFDNCNAIKLFDADSEYFRDYEGILYKALKTTGRSTEWELFRCPEGYVGSDPTTPEGTDYTVDIGIPETLTSVNTHAFDGCSHVQAFEKTTPTPTGEKTFFVADGILVYGDPDSKTDMEIVRCPEDYFKGTVKNPYAIRDDCVTVLWDHAFYNVDSRRGEITLYTYTTGGSGATSVLAKIGDYALANCSYDYYNENTEVYQPVPSAVTHIGNYAFAESLDDGFELTITNDITYIGKGAFYDCSGLETITVSGVSRPGSTGHLIIGDHTFYGCDNLTTLTVTNSVGVDFGDYAFYGCSKLAGTLKVTTGTTFGKHAFGGTAITALTIAEDVTSIGDYAFDGCTALTGTLVIPASVKTIGRFAFSGSGIQGLNMNMSAVETIGAYAFYKCTELKVGITIPATVTVLNEGAFCYSGITGITFATGSALKIIGNYAFYGCTGFNTSNILDLTPCTNLTTIGEYAFYGCHPTGDLVIPAKVTSIGEGAFMGTGITSLTVGDGSGTVNCTIGELAFSYSRSLKTLTLNKGVTSIGDGAFFLCDNEGFTTVKIPSTVKSIGDYAFAEERNVPRPPEDPEAFDELYEEFGIGLYALMALSTDSNDSGLNLTSLDLSEAYELTDIGNYAFWNCENLVIKVTAGESKLKNIGERAFEYCIGLKGTFNTYNIEWIGPFAFHGCSGITELAINEDVEKIHIGSHAFCECNGLTTLKLTKNVELGTDAFASCENLREVTIETTTIDDYAFKDCYNITDVVINGTETIGKEAFINCTSITRLTIGDSVKTIGAGAFAYCDSLENLKLGSELETIGAAAFIECTGFSGTLYIPDKVKTIGMDAFCGCTGITGLKLGDAVEIIGPYAFAYCSGIEGTLYIGNKVTTIEDSAFYGCKLLTGLMMGSSVKVIGDSAFDGCQNIKGTLTIGDSVVSIGQHAFYHCASITNLTLGSGLKSIGAGAFARCDSLSGQIEIPKNVSSIGVGAFSWCNGITKFTVQGGNTAYSSSSEGYLMNVDGSELIMCPTGMEGKISIPDSVSRIAPYAFYKCAKLSGELNLSDRVEYIGAHAFEDCTGITSVTISANRIDFGTDKNSNCDTFIGCKNLKEIKILSEVVVMPVAANAAVNVFDALYDRTGELIIQTPETLAQCHFAVNSEGKMTEELKLAKINFVQVAHGTVDATSLTAEFGSQVMVDGNVIIINGQKITATADEGYRFVGWSIHGHIIHDGPGMVRGSADIVPVFEKIEPVPPGPGPGPVPPGPTPQPTGGSDNTAIIICLSILAVIATIGVLAYIARARK